MEEIHCKRCGGKLKKEGGNYRCESCGAEFTDGSETITKLLDEQRERKIANLRALLYDAVHETYQDDNKIISACRELKAYLPDDFQANFYEIAASTSGERLNRFLLHIDVKENEIYIPDVVEFVLRSLEKSNITYLKALVERAFQGEERTKYNTRIEEEAEKVEYGLYEPSLTRHVFVAHSSADYSRVLPIVEKLEKRGFNCFVAQRNLRHGRGAVENYGKNLEMAMRSTQCFVFFSSKNSRKPDCEAITREIPYVRDNLPHRARVEYILDDYTEEDSAVKRTLASFFPGKEHCRSQEDLEERIYMLLMQGRWEEKPAVKYCLACGTENAVGVKFCGECGGKEFVSTKDEYYRIQNEKEIARAKNEFSDALMRQQKENEAKLKAEREAHEEAIKKAKEAQEKIEREKAEALKEAEAIRQAKEQAEREAEAVRQAKEQAEKEAEEAKRAAEAKAKEAEEARLRAEREAAERSAREAELAAASQRRRKEEEKESRKEARQAFFRGIGGLFSGIGAGVSAAAKKAGSAFALAGITLLWLATIALGLFNYIFPLTNYIWYGNGLAIVWYCTLAAEVVFATLTTVFTVEQFDEWIGIPSIVFLFVGLVFLILAGGLGANGFWVSLGLSFPFSVLGGLASIILLFVHFGLLLDDGWSYKKFTGIFPLFALYCLILSIFGGVIWGTDQCDGVDGKFYYKLLDDGTASVYVLEYDEPECIFPETVNGYTVTEVREPWRGQGKQNLKRVILPATLTSIDYSAFEGAPSLETVVLGSENPVIVHSYAFSGCVSLKEIQTQDEEGEYQISLGWSAFKDCASLTKIEVYGDIPDRAFYGCSALTEITVKDSVRTVGEEAFAYSGIPSFDFGGELVSVGKEAFKGSAITSLTLTGSLEVGERAFEDCVKLETVEFGLDVLPERLFSGCTGLKSISIDVREIPGGAFENCASLANVSFGEKLQKIGEDAFAGSGLTALEIDNKFLAIGEGAFSRCRSLSAVSIDCENIPRNAFADCTALKEVTIGQNVYSAEARSFAGTTALETLTVLGGDIKEKAFEGSGLKALTLKGGRCDNYAFEKLRINTVTVENGEISLGRGCFKECSSLKEAVLNLELLPESCFENCTALEKVTLGDELQEVGKRCFKNCTSLREGSANCVILGDYAYENCTALITVAFSERLETVGEGAFKKCGIGELAIENKELNLGKFAFEECERLASVTLDCNTLGEAAFRNCKKIAEVSVNCSTVPKSAFAFCEKLTAVTVGPYAVKICDAAFEKCTMLQTVTLHGGLVEGAAFKNSGGPRTLTAENTSFDNGACKDLENLRTLTVMGGAIGDNAFEHCENLREATLNCLAVALEAFKNCTSLQTVTIGENCGAIGARAFEGCEHLTSAVFLSPGGWQYQNLFWWNDIDMSDAARAAAELKRESGPSYRKN